MKLATIRPKVGALDMRRAATLTGSPDATPRMRGRAGMERRERWLCQNPFCVDCLTEGRKTAINTQADHQVPLWAGGVDDETNLATRCTDHHAKKTACEAGMRAKGGYDETLCTCGKHHAIPDQHPPHRPGLRIA